MLERAIIHLPADIEHHMESRRLRFRRIETNASGLDGFEGCAPASIVRFGFAQKWSETLFG